MKNKKFKLFDAVLAAVCIILVAESAAPAASIGNSQFFWWIFLLIAFFLPYGLVSAELSSTYPGEGGMYEWIKKAFGPKWGARVAWSYWINFPLWIVSLAVLATSLITEITGFEMTTGIMLAIQLAYVWLVAGLGCFKSTNDKKWIVNVGAFCKVFIMLFIGAIGIYVAITQGVANEYTLSSLLPSLDIAGLAFLSVIIFNFMGFEVITTFSSDMTNPKKQVPRAILLGGSIIAFFYILAAFGMSVAVPIDQISLDTGLLDGIRILIQSLGNLTNIIVPIIGVMFLYTLIANIASWSFGVNSIAKHAADNDTLPKIFGKANKEGHPYMSSLMNGIVATILIIIIPFLPNEDLFWSFFSFSLITFLMSYLPLFPAFLKLRKLNPDRVRPFKIEGGKIKLFIVSIIPMIILIVAILLSVIPLDLSKETLSYQIPLIIGVLIAIFIGEIFASLSKKKELKK